MMLLHVCCADCTLKFIESLKNIPEYRNTEIHLFYYNPNIHPQSEFTARQMALKKIAEENNLKLIVKNWTPDDYFSNIGDLNGVSRNDKKLRCPRCWQLRLSRTFQYAKENGFSEVSSTLVTSKYMDQDRVLEIANKLADKYEIKFIKPNVSSCDIKTSGFYKQNYCGCVYSLKEKLEEKHLVKTLIK
jgi:epoxyqueuosine reductase